MKLYILTYHAIGSGASVMCTDPDTFRRQVESLVQRGYQGITLREALSNPDVKGKQIVVTFDDAYLSVFEHALPVMKDLDCRATIFVPTGYCGQRANWKGAAGQVMDWDKLQILVESGFEIGSHSVDHLNLTDLEDKALRTQLTRSKKEIEDTLSTTCDSVAYPYGQVSRKVLKEAERLYRAGVTTHLGPAGPQSNPMRLPRIEMYYYRNLHFWEHLGRPQGDLYLTMRRLLRALRGQ